MVDVHRNVASSVSQTKILLFIFHIYFPNLEYVGAEETIVQLGNISDVETTTVAGYGKCCIDSKSKKRKSIRLSFIHSFFLSLILSFIPSFFHSFFPSSSHSLLLACFLSCSECWPVTSIRIQTPGQGGPDAEIREIGNERKETKKKNQIFFSWK